MQKTISAPNAPLHPIPLYEIFQWHWHSSHKVIRGGRAFIIDCTSGFDSTRIYGAFASGIDVYLNKHTDKDFTYWCTTIHMKVGYTLNQNIVGYFTFPRLGIAIPIRPGDVLFFNPQEPHCVSSCCDNADHIYCLSLYSTNQITLAKITIKWLSIPQKKHFWLNSKRKKHS